MILELIAKWGKINPFKFPMIMQQALTVAVLELWYCQSSGRSFNGRGEMYSGTKQLRPIIVTAKMVLILGWSSLPQ